MERSTARTLATQIGDGPTGAGIFVQPRGAKPPYLYHYGVNAGFRSLLVFAADASFGVVLMTNGAGGGQVIPQIPRRTVRRLRPRAVQAGDLTMAATTTAAPSDAIKRLLPWLVAVAFFMQSLDTTILNTAVPAIARAMDVTPLSMKSVLASYTLSLAVFIPISGWMADRFGTRRVFASAIGAVHPGLAAVRPGDQHRHAGRLPHPAGHGRRHDGAGRAHDHGAHLRQVRAGPRP